MELLTQLDIKYREKTVKVHQLKMVQAENRNDPKIEDLKNEIDQIIGEHKELKATYISIQEEKLYEKYQ